MKTCSKCGEVKDDELFRKCRNYCNKCNNYEHKIWCLNNYEKRKKTIEIATKKWIDKDPEHVRILAALSSKRSQEKSRKLLNNTYLKKQLIQHGFTNEEIKQFPELIQITKYQISIKRLKKSRKNGNKNYEENN